MNASLRPLPVWFVFLGVFLSVCLTGCGGGGNSSTDEGFRFVPNGQGAVIPYPNVRFEYDAGSVGSGVVVSAAPVAAPSTSPAGTAGSLLGTAYLVHFSTSVVTFSTRPRLFLPYTADTTGQSVARIYLYSPVANTNANPAIAQGWQVLPVNTSSVASGSSTILGGLLPANIEDGSTVAVYTSTPPATGALNPFFGSYTLTYAGSASGSFGLSVAADGTISGTTAGTTVTGTTVTGTVSAAGAASIVSGGQTYTGTLAVDPNTGAVTVSNAVWSGGTWSLQ